MARPARRRLFRPLQTGDPFQSTSAGQQGSTDLLTLLSQAQGKRQETAPDEDSNLPGFIQFFRWLERQTGAQAIKGAIAGRNESGIGDNFAEFFRKLPPVQLIEQLSGQRPGEGGGPGELTGEFVSAADARRGSDVFNFITQGGLTTDPLGAAIAARNVEINKKTDNFETGFQNFGVNLIGEFITDPLMFWQPFGVVGKGSNSAATIARRAGDVSEIALEGASLVKAVEKTERSLIVLRAFGSQGIRIPTPKALDLTLAHTIEGSVNFLLNNPATGSILRRLNGGVGKIPTIRGEGDFTFAERLHGLDIPLGASGAEKRAAVKAARIAGENAQRAQYEGYTASLMKIYRENPEFDTVPGFSETIFAMGDNGVTMSKYGPGPKASGLSFHDSKSQVNQVFMENGVNDRIAAKALKTLSEDPDALLDYEKALRGDVDSIFKVYEANRVPMPPRILAEMNLDPRQIDQFGMPKITRDQEIVQLHAAPSPAQVGRGKVERGLNDMSSIDREVLFDNVATARVKDFDKILDDAIKEGGEEAGEKLLTKMMEASDGILEINETMGKAEQLSGLINELHEFYLPRNLTPKMAKFLNDRFAAWINKGGQDFLNAAEPFMKQRKMTELNVFQVNAIARIHGLKGIAGGKALQEFESSARRGIQAVLADLFNGDTLRKFKSRFWKMSLDPDQAAKKSYDETLKLFETNPLEATYQRIAQGSRAMERHSMVRAALNDDSPLVDHVTTLGVDDAKNLELADSNLYVPIIESSDGGLKAQNSASLIEAELKNDAKSTAVISRTLQRNEIRERIMAEGAEEVFEPFIARAERAVGATEETAQTLIDAGLHGHTAAERSLIHHVAKGAELRQQIARGDFVGEDLVRAKLILKNHTTRGVNAHRLGIQGELESLKGIRQQVIDAMELGGQAGNRARFGAIAKTQGKLGEEKRRLLNEIVARNIASPDTQQKIKIFMNQRDRGFNALDELTDGQKASMAGSKVKWIRKENFDGVWGPGGTMDLLNSPDKMGYVLRAWDWQNDWWKGWTVVPFPQTRIRDVMTNVMLQVQFGAPMMDMVTSWRDGGKMTDEFLKTMRGLPSDVDNLDVKVLTNANGETASLRELLGEAQTRLQIAGGYVKDSIQQSFGDMAALAGARPPTASWFRRLFKIGNKGRNENPVYRGGFRVMEYFDARQRLTAFVAEWKSGKSFAEAAGNVRSYSYGTENMLSAFERHTASRLFPFYNFSKWIWAAQGRALVTRPGTLARWQRVYDTAHQAIGVDPKDFDKIVPEWVADRFGIPTSKGKGGIEYLILGGLIPQAEIVEVANTIEKFMDPDDKGTLANFFGSRMNPFLKSTIENARNHSFFTERNVENFPGETTEIMGLTVTRKTMNFLRSIRLLQELDRLNIFNFSDVAAIRKLANVGTLGLVFEDQDKPTPGSGLIGAGDAVDRSGRLGDRSEVGILGRIASSALGPVPAKLRQIDVRKQSEFRLIDLKKEEAKRKGQLKRRRRKPGDPSNVQDVETLRGLIRRNQKEQRQVRRLLRDFPR